MFLYLVSLCFGLACVVETPLKAADDTIFVLIDDWYNAIDQARPRILRKLTKHIASNSIDIKNEEGQTPLIKAAASCFYPLVKLFLQYKAHPMITDKKGYRALDYIIHYLRRDDPRTTSAIEIIDLICSDERFNPHMHRSDPMPLYNAIKLQLTEVVTALLEHNFNANVEEPESGKRPLEVAIYIENAAIVKTLLDHKANPFTFNKEGKSAYDLVHEQSYKHMAKMNTEFATIAQLVSDAEIL